MSEQTSTPLLSLRHLQSGYGDLRVVWDVSLDVWPGKVTALLGRNGAGKTSTLRAISGLNKITAGTLQFDGRDISKVAPHRRVRQGMAYVQEGKRVFHRLTVEQNLILGGYVRTMRRPALREEVDRIYELFPVLGRKRGLLAGAMSGGQQQMLAIGQALMAKPTLLLLDEPSGGLAPVIVNEVMERVTALKETGLAVLLVEQAVDAAMSVADHVTVLDVGRVVMDADAGEIDDRAVLRDAYFGRVGG
ncbi:MULTISPECIES: ABC transporter ATP-binding protein [unclassified Rhodococcus (in: high G+C Gram-positive bacteria)]|uniref:ABC transporter ATP-binding protein n=1 Tax=unclassified Rhodococcus (in: high G+C Gram-positive bacteria) TaxID=192944 RepID=UPI00163B446D|nr:MULTISPECIES: ABC transporter ATP-binding protein [unclassified Rhodococcus (in: high G+C Gram-positive bacteria)]MBC2639830.1 ABC transporter ATP-binding protein [Rhodococcus sp. 3A]MBC2895424.1 ABC transporter ATP-binding protein [Rhodococcus sp. 4CII]